MNERIPFHRYGDPVAKRREGRRWAGHATPTSKIAVNAHANLLIKLISIPSVKPFVFLLQSKVVW